MVYLRSFVRFTIVHDPSSRWKACWRGSNGDGEECRKEEVSGPQPSVIDIEARSWWFSAATARMAKRSLVVAGAPSSYSKVGTLCNTRVPRFEPMSGGIRMSIPPQPNWGPGTEDNK